MTSRPERLGLGEDRRAGRGGRACHRERRAPPGGRPGAFTSTDSTAGAPHRWVTPSRVDELPDASPRTARRQPACPPAPRSPTGGTSRCSGTSGASTGTRCPARGGGDVLAERVQVRAAVGVHHALGCARGARRVVDRDRGVLVVDGPRQRRVRAAGEELRVARPRHAAGAPVRPTPPRPLPSVLDGRDGVRQRGVGHEHPRARVEQIERTSSGARRVLMATRTPPASGAAKCATRSSRSSWRQVRDPVPGRHARGAQRVRRARDLRGQLGVGQRWSPSTTATRSAKTSPSAPGRRAG